MSYSVSAMALLAAVGSASAFTAGPSVAIGRGHVAPSLALRNVRPCVARGLTFRQGASRLSATAEAAEAAQHLAYLLSSHFDANTLANIDDRWVPPFFADTWVRAAPAIP